MVLNRSITSQIKEILKKNPQGLNITQIVREVAINRNTLSRYLENLLVSGQVEMRRFGMEKIYTLSQRVPLSAVLSISSELVVQLDSSLRIIFANEPFLKLVGTDSKTLLRKNIEYTPVPLVFDESFSGFIEHIRKGVAGKEWAGEIALSTKGIILFCRIAPTVFDDGRKGVSVILEDITTSKQSELELRESEDRYRTLVEISPDAVIVHQEGKITYLNPAALKLLGASQPDEILGKNILDFIQPEFRDKVRDNISKDLGGDTTPPMELHMSRINGTPVIVEGRGVRTFIGGKPAVQVALRDITETKRAEEALRESEKRLRLILDSTDDLVIMQDPEGRYLYFNSAARYGVSMEEMIGLTPYDLLDRVSADLFVERVKTVAKTGQSVREETPIVWKGQTIWFSDSLSPVRDAHGTITAVVTISQNITERIHAENALRESEATARALMNAPTDTVILMDSRGIILDLNETAAQKFGKPANEFVGVLVDDLLPKEVAQSRRTLVSKVTDTKKMVRFEDERDGRWYDSVAYPIVSKNGEVTRIALIARDITDRKNSEKALIQSEQRFRYLITAIGDIVWETDAQARFVYVSPQVETILGYKPDELIGHTPFEFLHPDAIGPNQKKFKAVIREHDKSVLHVSRWMHKDGHEVLIESNAIPTFDSNGLFSGFIGIDRKRE
jgi:PAS domain S-box-containing protein